MLSVPYLVLGHEHQYNILSRNDAGHPDTSLRAVGWDELVGL